MNAEKIKKSIMKQFKELNFKKTTNTRQKNGQNIQEQKFHKPRNTKGSDLGAMRGASPEDKASTPGTTEEKEGKKNLNKSFGPLP